MKLVRKGLFKNQHISTDYIADKYGRDAGGFAVIINNYTQNKVLKDLLYKFLKFIQYNIKNGGLKNQLNALSKFSEEVQIRLVSITIQKGWHSLLLAIEAYNKSDFDNTNIKFVSKEDIKKSINIVDEKF